MVVSRYKGTPKRVPLDLGNPILDLRILSGSGGRGWPKIQTKAVHDSSSPEAPEGFIYL